MAFSAQPLRDFLAAQKVVEELKPTVGSNLRAMRLEAGLSQAAVASNARVSQAYLSKIENDAKTPSSDSLERIINAMEGSFSGNSEEDGPQEGAQETEDR